MTDEQLLRDCDVHLHRSSGPGGQHRNKVSSAVRLRHRPTGVTAQAQESRCQHHNRRMALRRLRMNIACQLRQPVDLANLTLPAPAAQCMTPHRPGEGLATHRIEVRPKDARFWPVAALLLDVLEAAKGRLADAAASLAITTGNLVRVLKSEGHLFGAAQELRRRHGQKPLV